MIYLLIAAGGAIGAVSRFWLGTNVQALFKDSYFPMGTMTVNLIGCFLIGLIMGLVEFRGSVSNETRMFLVVGILGGFTTFSSFGYETLELIKAGSIPSALANVGITTGLGLCMVWLGNLVARQ